MKKWEKKEHDDAKFFGGKLTTASGRLWYDPGDVKTDVFLIDAKQTDKKSYTVSLQTWNKLCEEAAFVERIPLLSLIIQETELIVISRDDFLLLTAQKKSR